MATVNGTNNSERIDRDDASPTKPTRFPFGFGGDDAINGGLGADRINGEAGIDTARYGDSSEGVSLAS